MWVDVCTVPQTATANKNLPDVSQVDISVEEVIPVFSNSPTSALLPKVLLEGNVTYNQWCFCLCRSSFIRVMVQGWFCIRGRLERITTRCRCCAEKVYAYWWNFQTAISSPEMLLVWSCMDLSLCRLAGTDRAAPEPAALWMEHAAAHEFSQCTLQFRKRGPKARVPEAFLLADLIGVRAGTERSLALRKYSTRWMWNGNQLWFSTSPFEQKVGIKCLGPHRLEN